MLPRSPVRSNLAISLFTSILVGACAGAFAQTAGDGPQESPAALFPHRTNSGWWRPWSAARRGRDLPWVMERQVEAVGIVDRDAAPAPGLVGRLRRQRMAARFDARRERVDVLDRRAPDPNGDAALAIASLLPGVLRGGSRLRGLDRHAAGARRSAVARSCVSCRAS